ncbi:MAG: tetratricopeptide repeat protein, partial [Chryseobacterium sp.]
VDYYLERAKYYYEKDDYQNALNDYKQVIKIDPNNILNLSCESNEVWEENVFLIPDSIVEIVAFDSGYTILKFKEEKLSEQFKNYFEEDAIELKKINQ